MSIASVLEDRPELDATECLKMAVAAKEIYVGEDYFFFVVETNIGDYLYVKSSSPKYPFKLIKLLVKYGKENEGTLYTDVQGKSQDMRKFLEKQGFVEKDNIYLRKV